MGLFFVILSSLVELDLSGRGLSLLLGKGPALATATRVMAKDTALDTLVGFSPLFLNLPRDKVTRAGGISMLPIH